MTPTEQKKYDARLKRLQDALALKEPDRVPIDITGGCYMIQRLGYTMAESNYDETMEIGKEAARRFMLDYEPDVMTGLNLTYAGEGRGHEMQGSRTLYISGMANAPIGNDSMPQFIEFPTLYDDEFEEFFYDYTRWSLNKFLPRVSSVMEPFRDFQLNLSHRGIGEVAAAFSKPEIRKAIKKLWEIDDFYQVYRKKLATANEELAELGFPSMTGGRAVVPFDKYSDTYRGMELTFVDIFEDENLVMKFCNKFHKEQIEQLRHENPDGKKTGKQIVMALHKGSDDMMSNAFYEKFYWNHLKEIIAACREAGMMANVFCEGMYNDKLKYLAEVEKGSAYFTFDKVNMQKAKKTVGSVCCIGGGFPTPLLVYETPEKVREAVKRHLDVAMPDGGYIFRMSAGLDGAKAENVEAMFETVHEYGKYC